MSRRDVPEIRKVAGVLTDMSAVKLRERQAAQNSGKKTQPPPSLKGNKKGSSRYDDFDDFDDGDAFDD